MLSKTLFIDIYYMKGYIYKITNPNGWVHWTNYQITK